MADPKPPTVRGGQVWQSPTFGQLYVTVGKPFHWDEGAPALGSSRPTGSKSIKLLALGSVAPSRTFVTTSRLKREWTHMPDWENPHA